MAARKYFASGTSLKRRLKMNTAANIKVAMICGNNIALMAIGLSLSGTMDCSYLIHLD